MSNLLPINYLIEMPPEPILELTPCHIPFPSKQFYNFLSLHDKKVSNLC